jgi:hypothetical protein
MPEVMPEIMPVALRMKIMPALLFEPQYVLALFSLRGFGESRPRGTLVFA